MQRSDPNYMVEWRRKKSENSEYRAQRAAYAKMYRDQNKESVKKHRATYYQNNIDLCKQKSQSAYHADVDMSREKLRTRAIKTPWKIMCSSSKKRAKDQNLEFNITPDYIESIWPSNNKCPVFDTEFNKARLGESRDTSASIDRIIPSRGYVEGNIIIVSLLANRMKNNGSLAQLKRLYEYYSSLLPNT